MADPFVGEIRIFAGNFAPRGWAFCDGQLLPVSQNTALFSILGNMYGGDGKTNFALPNLQGRAPMHQGAGPGLTPRTIGEFGGTSTVTLLESEIPSHTHQPQAYSGAAGSADPTNQVWAKAVAGRGSDYLAYAATTSATMSAQAVVPAGGSQPHNNMQPYLGLSFIIALQGVYPARP